MTEQAPPEELEARARDLLAVPFAWPLSRRLARRTAFSERRLHLHDRLARKQHFTVMQPYDFQPDRLSGWVVERNSFEETFAATFRVKNDLDLPGDVLDAVQHNHNPQFSLRNIGRVERNGVDPDDPLPLERSQMQLRDADRLVAEARNPRTPDVQPVEIWSGRMMGTVRSSLRRLLLEDPWEWRFGAEVKANYNGPMYNFIVEGTHPDDLPDAWWGPDLIPVPEQWSAPPEGSRGPERALSMQDIIRRAESRES